MRRCAALLTFGVLVTLGSTGCTCTGTHSDLDASSVDTGPAIDAAMDVGPGGPPGPERVWVADGAGMCPELNAPTYEGRSFGVARGSLRWNVPTRAVSTPTLVGPTYVSNASMWTLDLWALDLIDHDLGDEERNAYHDPLVVAPSMFEEGTVWRYQHAPMSLGANMAVSRDAFGLFYVDFTRTGGARRWSFPELESMVNRAEPLPAENVTLDHVMPAWSPRTGQIAYPVGYDHSLIAVSCPMEDGGQFILRRRVEGTPYLFSRVYYRANGELLLHSGPALFVLSPRGETLRAASRPREAEPYAYQEGCGLLYREGTTYTWFDVDSMTSGHVFEMRTGWSPRALSDCRLMANGEILGTDGTRVGVAGSGDIVSELSDGRFVRMNLMSQDYYLLGPSGSVVEGPYRFESAFPVRAPYFTPDGHVMFRTRDCTVFYELNLPPPGPMLWPEAGMNWAHTNSPLPTPR